MPAPGFIGGTFYHYKGDKMKKKLILFSALMFGCGDKEKVQEEAQEETEGEDSSAESEEPAE